MLRAKREAIMAAGGGAAVDGALDGSVGGTTSDNPLLLGCSSTAVEAEAGSTSYCQETDDAETDEQPVPMQADGVELAQNTRVSECPKGGKHIFKFTVCQKCKQRELK